MDKILHTGWAKWIAGLFMMLAFSAGIYFGVWVVAAAESGGLEILSGDVPQRYEESKICARDLANQVRYALYNELQTQGYKQNIQNLNDTAMTVLTYEQWGSRSSQIQSLTAEEQAEREEGVVYAGEGQPYTYNSLLNLRSLRKVTEDASAKSDFFDDGTGEEKPDIYVEVDSAELIKQIKSHAGVKYALDAFGEVIENVENVEDEDFEETTASDNVEMTTEVAVTEAVAENTSDQQLYRYEVNAGEDVWNYNEYTGELYCSRFGQVKKSEKLYYNQADLETYESAFLKGEQQDAGVALLSAPMCYFDGLIEHYTRNYVLYKEQKEILEKESTDFVNYRYRVELQDGTIRTNAKDMKDITEGASVYWSYSYDSGDISGTMSESNGTQLYDTLTSYAAGYVVEISDDETVDLQTYLQENAKSISISLAEKMEHKDVMKSSKSGYEENFYLYQHARTYMGYTVLFGLLGLLLFVYLLLVVGYQDHKGTRSRAPLSFRIPTELMLLLALVLSVVIVAIGNDGSHTLIDMVGGELNFVVILGIAMLWSILPIAFEMLSRVRHREFLARSICFRGVRYILGKPVRWFGRKLGNMKRKLSDVTEAVKVDTRLCAIFMASQAGLFVLILLGFAFFADQQEFIGLVFLCIALFIEAVVCLVVFRDIRYTAEIIQGVEMLKNGNLDYQIPTEHMQGHKKELAENINHLQNGLKLAVEQSIKDERLKTELITNVSHDIKTPLTSIINYVDLLKKEPATGETAMHYLEVLDQKSQRLKQLMEDLVEVSKSATGNVDFTPMRLDLLELLRQILGEFEDKFTSRNLEVIENFKLEVAVVNLDSRHTFRVFENLCQNIYKYAMENSRVYVDVMQEQDRVQVVLKNISQYALNISADELMERFVRGDESRNTSGSGLGLSITRNLVTLQQGEFMITLDGDLFKATVIFPLADTVDTVNDADA